eukprot:jgi/Botrbrau1/22430/Bobra.0091s0032.1
MTGTSNRRLAIALFRGILRWTRSARGVPCNLRPSDVHEVVPELAEFNAPFLQDFEAIPQLTRIAFRNSQCLKGDDAEQAIDRGFLALRLLNSSYAEQVKGLKEARAARTDREGILFSIGQVFLHKKYGYTGVIYGWDKTCDRNNGWANELNLEPNQPFYNCLPDEEDCARLFGHPRISKYVAQENIDAITDARVLHRAIANYFEGYSRRLGRYVPNRRLQYEYPDNYDAPDLEPCAVDANLLIPAKKRRKSSSNRYYTVTRT